MTTDIDWKFRAEKAESERNALRERVKELREALAVIINSDMAMREEDEGRISSELERARAALAKDDGKGGEA